MTKTLYGYCGKLGSGKWYCASQEVEKLKTTGHTVYMISYADPLKSILRECFGLTKEGKVKTVEISEEIVKDAVVSKIHDYISIIDNHPYKSLPSLNLMEIIVDNYDKHAKEFFDSVYFASFDIDYKQNFRRAAQLLGTELGRHVLDSIWIDIAFAKVKFVFDNDLADVAFIDDVRFLNEAKAFKNFELETGYKAILRGVTVSDKTRAKRRGMTITELKAQDNHASEMEIEKIIASLPTENVIVNE